MAPTFDSGGGGGDGSGGSLSPSSFVDGATIRVQLLVSTILGGIVLSWWYGFWEFLENAGTWATELATALPETQGELIDAVLSIPGGMFDTAYVAASEFIAIPELGPFAFPIAMVLTAVVLFIFAWTIDNAGVI